VLEAAHSKEFPLRLKDSSIAVLKIYDRSELVKPENAHAYLTAVRNAFSDRKSVLEKSDLEPKITLFVFNYLQQQEVSEPDIEKRIGYMTGCVKDFSWSSQGEYNFFKIGVQSMGSRLTPPSLMSAKYDELSNNEWKRHRL